ncbi:MAG TPA: hypothetical protein VK502_00325, partial [Candidatus Saccharimonadales bacterium]|nr:hypothetical protein [Candidatus Saccharimonadales bacterium]
MNLKKALMLGVGLVIIGALSYSYVSFHAKPKVSFSNCSTGRPAHSLLAKSSLSSLRALAEYEAVCHGAVTDTLMTFAAMPTTQVEARQSAKLVATTLKQFAAQKITPLVVFEPSSVQPTILAEIKSGIYDTVLEDYYAALKVEGITDAQMGTWVLFPEANTPAWHTTHPNDFAANVRKVASLQKQVFPASKVSILLNSRTYPDDDKAWNHGKLQSLVPYVADLPKGLVDSFGYQGFPSASAADASVAYSQLEAPDFLPARLAIEAAKKMAVKRIWLNTGT